jgi:hypothetical protein
MARIIVIADMPRRGDIDAPVLMDEEVKPDHLADEHCSQQIIERMAWAVLDAEEAPTELTRLERSGRPVTTARDSTAHVSQAQSYLRLERC